MKNITRYFVDTVKSSDNILLHSNSNEKEETKSKKSVKEKHNYATIKISKTNAKKRICNIIESNNDITNETPNPCMKVSNARKNVHQTSEKSSSLKLSPTKYNKSQGQHLDYLSLEANDVLNIKDRKQIKNINPQTFSNSSHGKDSSINANLNNMCKNKQIINSMNFLSIDSNSEIEDNHEGSNAFQILMNRNKSIQCVLPTKVLPQNEKVSLKKSEEYREKLKHSKEKLTALVDRKEYFKRKLSEREEGDKIESTIQNRVKLFKAEEKKDNSVGTNVLHCKQSSNSLLDYFSKTPVNLTHTNTADISTIVVKADVHMSEDAIKHDLCNLNSGNGLSPNKKSKSSDLKFSQIDDSSIINFKDVNTLNSEKKQPDQQQQNKRRWSLRIKLQSYEDENTSPDISSDEELFSPNGIVKLNTENSKKSGISKNMYLNNLHMQNKSKKGISKQINEHMKLKLKTYEQREALKDNVMLQNDEHLKAKFENMHRVSKSDTHNSALVQTKNINDCIDIGLKSIRENKFDHENCIIINENNSIKRTTDKLAPLFIKRQKPDSKVTITKQLLLQTDIKDNKTAGQKVNVCSALPFPLVSHITQLNNSICNERNNLNIPEKVCNKLYIPEFNVNNYKYIIDFSEVKLKMLKNINKPKIQEVLTEIEKHCSDVKKMWNIISLIVKGQSNKTISPKMKIKKNKQLEQKEAMECSSKENQSENCCWTYKYRPKCAQEVVGNEEAATKLRKWLIGWKTLANQDVSSGDEFYSSDSSSNSKISENNQVAVLLGPHGSGKTASVYAVAEEFGYIVLELNASSRRTGKKLLKELEEATKSHRIKKEERTSAFGNSTSDEIIPQKIPQNSLILIEDVDIVFEEDEGFISATYHLASNTKRPIVMTCKDVCPHLSKLAPQQNRIYFQSAVGNRVSALLELISLAETGYRLPCNYIAELLQSGDLRKAILQLQYLLLSGPPQISEQPINFKNSFWQNMRYHLYKPAIRVSKKRKRKEVTSNELMNDTKHVLNDIASKLDNIVLLSSLIDIEDSTLNLWQLKTQPSLSLVESPTKYSMCNNVCLEMAEWIGSRIMYKDQLKEYNGVKYQNNNTLKKQLNKGVSLALSHATSLLLDRQIIATDYLSSIRTICRAEEYRANMNDKRGNRFFHYLHNLKSSTLLKPNILAAACKIMHDKVETNIPMNKNSSSFT